MANNHFFVTTEPLDHAHYLTLVTAPEYGAVASFLGTVRSPNLGENVLYIDYEGYESMMYAQMKVVAKTLRDSLDLGHLVLAHRLGKMFHRRLLEAPQRSSTSLSTGARALQGTPSGLET
jgi:molybdopterin synthase catalytic subunit